MSIHFAGSKMMIRTVPALFASILLAACNPAERTEGWEYKDCRFTLTKRPDYSDMGGDARLKVIDQCMREKGLRPSSKCTAAGAQGKPHCEYEPAPQNPTFKW